jgi:hypothetical protein
MLFPAPPQDYDGAVVDATLAAGGLPVSRPQSHRTPSLVNTILVGDLGGEKRLLFRLGHYRVPPVSYRDGAFLLSLYRRLRQAITDLEGGTITEEEARRLHKNLCDRCVATFPRLVIPMTRLHRWLFRWLPNPFTRCSDEEIFELLGFFLACRTRSSVREVATPNRPPSKTRLSISSTS